MPMTVTKLGLALAGLAFSASAAFAQQAAFKPAIEDYYLTNPIARASAVMAECSRLASGQMLTAAE